jgi:hypothetical protein
MKKCRPRKEEKTLHGISRDAPSCSLGTSEGCGLGVHSLPPWPSLPHHHQRHRSGPWPRVVNSDPRRPVSADPGRRARRSYGTDTRVTKPAYQRRAQQGRFREHPARLPIATEFNRPAASQGLPLPACSPSLLCCSLSEQGKGKQGGERPGLGPFV